MNKYLSPDCIFFVKVSLRYYKVNTADIVYIEAEKNYVQINTKTQKFRIHSTIKKMFEKMPSGKFVQVHRSFIIRLDAVSEIDGAMERLIMNGKHIPIGDTFRRGLKNNLNIIEGTLNTQT